MRSSAYEIATIHQRDPPPKEILEDISARGGDLLNRTMENFKPPAARETGNLANGHDSDGSGDEEHKTPKAEKMDVDDPGSGGRVTRGNFSSVQLNDISSNMMYSLLLPGLAR